MSISTTFDGYKLDDMQKWTVNGSSSPQAFNFPLVTGTLLKPSKNVTRNISLVSRRFPANASKTTIETWQHNLAELLIERQSGTLTVDGVQYTNATPISVTQNIIPNNAYFEYTLIFELSKDQSPFRPSLASGVVRAGKFTDYPGTPPINGFPIFDNYEAGISVAYGSTVQQREVGDYGVDRTPAAGVEVINLTCWMVDQTTQNFQKYMADWMLDPLGKQGTLNLNGLIFYNTIMTNVSCEQQVGSSLKYNLQFNTTLAC